MARRYRPGIQVQRDEILNSFYGFSDAPHVVYAVVQRFGRDRSPIYVGETSKPRKRFEQHLKVARGGRENRSAIGRRERGVVERGGALEFHALEDCQDRIHVLAREAAWARALRRAGCNLANTWPEHRAAAQSDKVPLSR